MFLAGLTGGMGSGKTTVARRFAELGAHVIDADDLARAVVAPGQPALAAIAERFGSEVIDGDGALDRAGLAAIVFADDEARSDLEAITHPRIRERMDTMVADHAAAERDEPRPRLVVVDHPLLVESGLDAGFPAVVVVLAPIETRVARLEEGRGIAPEDARARMRAQASDEQRRAAATHVIDNAGDLDDLLAAADRVFDRLRAAADQSVAGEAV